jgi:hypothetical protein
MKSWMARISNQAKKRSQRSAGGAEYPCGALRGGMGYALKAGKVVPKDDIEEFTLNGIVKRAYLGG